MFVWMNKQIKIWRIYVRFVLILIQYVHKINEKNPKTKHFKVLQMKNDQKRTGNEFIHCHGNSCNLFPVKWQERPISLKCPAQLRATWSGVPLGGEVVVDREHRLYIYIYIRYFYIQSRLLAEIGPRWFPEESFPEPVSRGFHHWLAT